ncbi:transmembrane protein [Anaeramoeba flamelloides]|uniref:Transmembrane protein n=1 Tax=Anaeramoeba flamelloides TaxID=1746091 RepID=A0AAV7YG15_9EUKA|nr:transmembrane protein [Anaeramoeba flamelloides]
MESPVMRMRIDGWGKKKFFFFYLLFFGTVIIGLIVGGVGPYRYEQKIFKRDLSEDYDVTTFYLEVVSLNRLNQHLFMDTHFLNGDRTGVIKNINISVWVWGTNDLKGASDKPNFTEDTTVGMSSGNSDSDDDITDGWDLLEFSKHTRKSKLYQTHVGMSYFEIFFRYFFVLVTLIWIFLITRSTKGISFRSFTAEQQWIYILLILLLLFDNPLHPLTLLSHDAFVQVLDALFTVTFIIALNGFWLCMLDRFRYDNKNLSFVKFYLPKLVPLFVMWITYISIYMYTRTHEFDDPQFETVNDVPGFRAAFVIFWIMYTLIILWIIYVSVRAFIETKENPEQRKGFFFFFSLFLITFIMILIAIIGNFIPSLRNKSIEFLSYFIIANVYILSLSIAYLPSSKVLGDIKVGKHTKLDEELVADSETDNVNNSDYILDDKSSPNTDYEMRNKKSEKSENEENSEESVKL